MEIKKVNNQRITRAESICLSGHFIISCCGQSVSIFDKDLNLIKLFKGLSHVYKAIISPDESKIALISSSNLFYVVDTGAFSIMKLKVNGIAGGDLDGRGCWSFDSKQLYLLPFNAKTYNSVIRIYDTGDWSYTDTLCDRFFLTVIKQLKRPNTYFLIGYDRTDGVAGSFKLIWLNGSDFTFFNLECERELFSVIGNARLDEKEERIILLTDTFSYDCGLTGGKLSRIQKSKEETSIEIQSANGDYLIKTDGCGITVTSKQEPSASSRMNIRYGVLDIAEIGHNIFLVSTKDGLRLIEVDPWTGPKK